MTNLTNQKSRSWFRSNITRLMFDVRCLCRSSSMILWKKSFLFCFYFHKHTRNKTIKMVGCGKFRKKRGEDDQELPLATISEAFSFAETTRVKLLMVAGCISASLSGLCVPGKTHHIQWNPLSHGMGSIGTKTMNTYSHVTSSLLSFPPVPETFYVTYIAMAWVFSDSFTDLTTSPDDPQFMLQISWLSIRFVIVGYVESVMLTIGPPYIPDLIHTFIFPSYVYVAS